MTDKRGFVRKTPAEILEDVLEGHKNASFAGEAQGKKYLINFLEKFDSVPNAVKFFVYDLLCSDAYLTDDIELCLDCAEKAMGYLEDARQDAAQAYRNYLPDLKFCERGISAATDMADFEKALVYCDKAIELSLGKMYESKRTSIVRQI